MTFEREAERWGEAMGRKLGDPALGRQLAQEVKQQNRPPCSKPRLR